MPATIEAPAVGLVRYDPYTVVERNGRRGLTFDYHDGQRKAMRARKRFVLVLAGTQGGKTIFGPWWLFREMRRRGPGDYIMVAPTFRLLELKALPEYERLFVKKLGAGTIRASPSPMFTTTPEGDRRIFGRDTPERSRILFGHAADPDSLESATAKAAHLDEAGQKKFKRGSWEAIQRRLSIHEGRALITTTPYLLGWLKTELHDPALAGAPDVDLIQFASVMNPAFPRAEFERMRRNLPAWKFNMMYRGIFERPAGLIYDVFRRDVHVVQHTPKGSRFAGVDFGGTNTVAVEAVRDADPETEGHRLVVSRVYRAGGRSAKEHAAALSKGGRPVRAWGGAASEKQWRLEFKAGGYPIRQPPVTGAASVEVGINRVYALLKNHPLLDGEADDAGNVIRHDSTRPYIEFDEEGDGVPGLLEQIEQYSRELDDDDEPTEKIEDKEAFHDLDALRYLAVGLGAHRTHTRRTRKVTL